MRSNFYRVLEEEDFCFTKCDSLIYLRLFCMFISKIYTGHFDKNRGTKCYPKIILCKLLVFNKLSIAGF
jgi:hypothetical protein